MPTPRNRAPRRRVKAWGWIANWGPSFGYRLLLACGHVVRAGVDDPPRIRKHTRRACRKCGEEGR